MKLLQFAAIAVAFSTLVGIHTASAISSENDAGDTSSTAPLADPDQATENFGSSGEGSGSFSIMVPDQSGDQLQFGTTDLPLLPSFPSDTSQ
ncbi:hypothetical protein ACFPL7_06350 [Dongia soli]|uniref:Secreted protein n=1 Tax=Dongia soli TaxID=600628 RepID=A0ABU5E9G8_9PROT|nr:hypothetical protein [Dongia soli]MDY0882562.1 hypothetical protein [Dongia soli]